ncbi:hypothetical protein KIN20_017884 [Parelaphostrongylus tenuis]|uniref:Uncharacterized protein n=1 Tax=Parelaphostrongylus tenuis TaxID=148309 RepID=A0AAD5MH03_PARTN|nr:hypothetical protein KIN20_002680 [Parelaphostrongylus tenuis]KAJ1359200.1 hypothetical protein KIN20_017884 [Parelaphostrongylus tenuis]
MQVRLINRIIAVVVHFRFSHLGIKLCRKSRQRLLYCFLHIVPLHLLQLIAMFYKSASRIQIDIRRLR